MLNYLFSTAGDDEFDRELSRIYNDNETIQEISETVVATNTTCSIEPQSLLEPLYVSGEAGPVPASSDNDVPIVKKKRGRPRLDSTRSTTTTSYERMRTQIPRRVKTPISYVESSSTESSPPTRSFKQNRSLSTSSSDQTPPRHKETVRIKRLTTQDVADMQKKLLKS